MDKPISNQIAEFLIDLGAVQTLGIVASPFYFKALHDELVGETEEGVEDDVQYDILAPSEDDPERMDLLFTIFLGTGLYDKGIHVITPGGFVRIPGLES